MTASLHPESRIARFPAPLRPAAALAGRSILRLRALWPRNDPPTYVFEADGMATVHHSPFLEDAEFTTRYEEMTAEWFVGLDVDARWRMWLLTRFAQQCRDL